MRRSLALLLALTLVLAGCDLGEDESSPTPQVGVQADEEQAAEKLGFPASATRNTIRVGGADAAADAAGVANALYPATGDADRPTAVVLVDQEDWVTGVAASVLASPPLGAPILLSDADDLPSVTEETLDRLDPKGSDLSEDAQVIRLGPDVRARRASGPRSWRATRRSSARPRSTVSSPPPAASPSNDIVLYSGDQAEWAMPAAAWAARSGDAALPVRKDEIPAPVLDAIREHESPNVFVLGRGRHLGARDPAARRRPGRRAQEEGSKQRRPGTLGRAHRGRHPGRERDRLRPLREGRLRLGRGRARLQLHARQRLTAARRRRSRPLATRGVFAPLAPDR